ncbi:MAG: ATP-binding cassette domain-containing protein, partial [Oscillospiraceae bacterium]
MIEIKNVCKTYNPKSSNKVEVLKNFNAVIENNMLTAIIGTSGAGKSTLMNLLCGIDRFESGEILVDGVNLKELKNDSLSEYRNKKVGLVLQNSALVEDFNVFENVEVPLIFANKHKKERTNLVVNALEETGIADLLKRKSNKLSGGQKQRVAIARSTVNKAPILIFDDSLSAVDTETDIQIRRSLKERM